GMPGRDDQRLVVSQTAGRSNSALYRDVRAGLLQKYRDRKNPENGQNARPLRALPATFVFARRSSFANGVQPIEENNTPPSWHLELTDQSICLHTVCLKS